MNLEIKSPIHIGNSERIIYPIDYIRRKKDFVIVDEIKLIKELELMGSNILDNFTIDISNSKINELGSLLERYGISNDGKYNKIEFYNKIFSYRIFKYQLFDYPESIKIQQFIRNCFYRPYVPGSSIKGSIKTALMYYYLKKLRNEDYGKFEKIFVNKFLENIKYSKSLKSFAFFLNKIFDQYTLGDAEKGPHTNIMRAIKIFDSNPINKDQLLLFQVDVFRNKSYMIGLKNRKSYVECLPTKEQYQQENPNKIQLRFELKIDENILINFDKYNTNNKPFFSTQSDILRACKEFSDDIINYEKGFYQNALSKCNDIEKDNIYNMIDFYNHLDANLRIGWGSGLISTTMFLLLPPSGKTKINEFWENAYGDTPVSRRLITKGDEIISPLGWVKIG